MSDNKKAKRQSKTLLKKSVTFSTLNKSDNDSDKQSRSEIIQIRLTPKLRYKMEIAARLKSRTISSLFEYIAIKFNPNVFSAHEDREPYRLSTLLEDVWSNDEPLRFTQLAQKAPHLLSPEEVKIWEFITHEEYFWTTTQSEKDQLVIALVRAMWLELKSYARTDNYDRAKLSQCIIKLASEHEVKEEKLQALQKLLEEIWASPPANFPPATENYDYDDDEYDDVYDD